MSDAILVLDADSSRIRFSVFSADGRPSGAGLVCDGACAGIGDRVRFTAKDAGGAVLIDEPLAVATTYEDAIAVLFGWLEGCFSGHRVVAAGHRVVHGGSMLTTPVRIDAAVIGELRRLVPLAPLTQPKSLAAIAALGKLFPGLEQIACFDTAFHRTLPAVATAFALPRDLTGDGIRRYGFHGLAYEYVASEMPGVLGGSASAGRVVVAHLGDGASLCAMDGGKSVATTTGFSELDGLPSGRRCGSLDPGVVLYLIREKGMTAAQVAEVLYEESGLAGMSGVSDDVRVLLAADRPSAEDAVALFVYRIEGELGSMAAALGGLDALIFTAGIGEHSAEIRRRVCENAAWLGVDLDDGANETGGPRITRSASRTSAWIIPARVDVMIARHVWTILNATTPAAPRQPSERVTVSVAREG